jgi:hypothetical protein
MSFMVRITVVNSSAVKIHAKTGEALGQFRPENGTLTVKANLP